MSMYRNLLSLPTVNIFSWLEVMATHSNFTDFKFLSKTFYISVEIFQTKIYPSYPHDTNKVSSLDHNRCLILLLCPLHIKLGGFSPVYV